MERIEITTSHNVVVRFELATLPQRLLACTIDLVILVIYSVVVMAIFQSQLFFWLLVFPVIAFYHLAFEVFDQGRSLGKRIMKIQVISLEGRTAKVNDYLIRWVFRLIEVLPSLGSIAMIFISTTGKNQRLGDLLANTTVVRHRNEKAVQLNSLNNIEVTDEIRYPAVSQFADTDMLLVKQAVSRYMSDPHPNNKSVIDELCSRIADKLHVDMKGVKKIEFLNRVLYEYVVLTR